MSPLEGKSRLVRTASLRASGGQFASDFAGTAQCPQNEIFVNWLPDDDNATCSALSEQSPGLPSFRTPQDQSGGNGESTSNPRRCAIWGYLAINREKFRRALATEVFGCPDGYRPISAQRFIFLATRCSRIGDLAFNSIFLRLNSGSALFVAELGSHFLPSRMAI